MIDKYHINTYRVLSCNSEPHFANKNQINLIMGKDTISYGESIFADVKNASLNI